MTAVGVGQQGSQAVGSVFESLPCHAKNFYNLSLKFSTPEASEILMGSPTKTIRHCETKNFRRSFLILPPSYP